MEAYRPQDTQAEAIEDPRWGAARFVSRHHPSISVAQWAPLASFRMLWQTNFTASSEDLIALQEKLAGQVRQGLLPILGSFRAGRA
jgi:hypothetical protein